MRSASGVVVVSSVVMATGIGAYGQVSFRGLGTLAPELHSFARALSPDGSVPVGRAMAYNPGGDTSGKPVVWDPAIRRLVRSPDFYDADTTSSSLHGATQVGWGQIGNGQGGPVRQQAFRATVQGVFDLPGLSAGDFTYAHDITPDGRTIVGGVGVLACTWTEAQAPIALASVEGASSSRALSVSSDARVIAGTYRRNSSAELCVWLDGVALPIELEPVSRSSLQASVSLDGSRVAGSYLGNSGQRGAFTWTLSEGVTPLDGITSALCLSGDGQIIGGSTPTNAAALWMHGDTFLVRDLLTSQGVDVSDWTLSSVSGISADGRTITGNGTHRYGPGPADMHSEAWVAVIPSPSVAPAAVIMGFAGAVRRRRA